MSISNLLLIRFFFTIGLFAKLVSSFFKGTKVSLINQVIKNSVSNLINGLKALNLEKLCEALGIADVKVIDPNDIKAMEAGIKDSLSKKEPSVIISRRPCVLLKEVKKDKYFVIDSEKCRSCKACMQIGCPAISMVDGKAKIDTTLCTGCGLCEKMCKFDCIIEKNR